MYTALRTITPWFTTHNVFYIMESLIFMTILLFRADKTLKSKEQAHLGFYFPFGYTHLMCFSSKA